MNKAFTKSHSKTLDNRSAPLPTLWSEYQYDEVGSYYGAGGDEVFDTVFHQDSLSRHVVRVIDDAEEMLVLCSFLLADNAVEQALLQAEKRGVRVYCLIAAEARLDRENPEGEFDKKVLSLHKAMLKKLAGKVMFRTSSSFHAKVVLADPFTSVASGVLLTANLTTDAMERNEELLLKLKANEVKQLAEYFKWAIWEVAEHESIKSGNFDAVKLAGKVEHPGEMFPVIATTSQCQQISEQALAMIDGARSDILVSCFGWDLEHKVVQALITKAKAGVSVTVFARIRPASVPALEALAKAGATVLGFKWLHAKALVIDGQKAMVMSANFQKHGLDEGFELGVLFDDDRLDDLIALLKHWQSQARWQLQTDATVGEVLGQVRLWDGKSFVDDVVQELKSFDRIQLVAASAESLDTDMPAVPESGRFPHLAQELRRDWVVCAPSLGQGAKQQFQPAPKDKEQPKDRGKKSKNKPVPYNPPVYQEPSGRKVVAIKSPSQLQAAVTLKSELKLSAVVVE